jgi:ribosomal-protein-alanine N-acetyltransferase
MSRILLRRVAYDDGPAMIKAHRKSLDFLHPWVGPFTDEAGFEAWYGRLVTGPNVSFLAIERDSGEIAGVINISQIVMGLFRSAYLGYYAVAGVEGRGLMAEALAQVLDFAFGELGLHRLEANIQPGNARSIALVERLGFRKEGFSPRYLKIDGDWRDHERWAILAEDREKRV